MNYGGGRIGVNRHLIETSCWEVLNIYFCIIWQTERRLEHRHTYYPLQNTLRDLLFARLQLLLWKAGMHSSGVWTSLRGAQYRIHAWTNWQSLFPVHATSNFDPCNHFYITFIDSLWNRLQFTKAIKVWVYMEFWEQGMRAHISCYCLPPSNGIHLCSFLCPERVMCPRGSFILSRWLISLSGHNLSHGCPSIHIQRHPLCGLSWGLQMCITYYSAFTFLLSYILPIFSAFKKADNLLCSFCCY